MLRLVTALHLLLESVDGLSSFLLRAEALTADLLRAQTALPAARLTHTHTLIKTLLPFILELMSESELALLVFMMMSLLTFNTLN